MNFLYGAVLRMLTVIPPASVQIVIATLVRAFVFEPAGDGVELEFYHMGGNTVKSVVRGRKDEGVQMPLHVMPVREL